MTFLDSLFGAIGHDTEATRLDAIAYGAELPDTLD
jgi:hypothetical protein